MLFPIINLITVIIGAIAGYAIGYRRGYSSASSYFINEVDKAVKKINGNLN